MPYKTHSIGVGPHNRDLETNCIFELVFKGTRRLSKVTAKTFLCMRIFLTKFNQL